MPQYVDDAPFLENGRHPTLRRSSQHTLSVFCTRFLARRRNAIGLFLSVCIVVFLCVGFVIYDQLEMGGPFKTPDYLHYLNSTTEPVQYAELARMQVDALFARQSKTFQQAKARYTLKNNRPPPPGYLNFYGFAKERSCLIDDYDKVYRDFEPFYQLAEHHPTFFPDMLERAMKIAAEDYALCLSPLTLRDHKGAGSPHYSPYEGDWAKLLEILGPLLPDMDLLFNYQDEPRVLFNTRRPDAYEFALKKTDNNPFRQGPRPTKEYYEEDTPHQCLLPNSATGFGNITNDLNAFMVSSTSTQHTHDLYPVMSPGRVSTCFSDIIVPSSVYPPSTGFSYWYLPVWQFYYDRSWYAARTSWPDNVPWVDKKPVIYWRGHTSGGAVDGQNYHSFARFRIIDFARRRPDIINAALTGLHNCNPDPNNAAHAVCPEDEIKGLYDVDTPPLPREEVYKYKYTLDLDGNGFSGRFMGLLRSGSLVFKSTIFSDFFDDWLLPNVHYIPVLPDLSDLEKKIEWAIENDEEARQIQANGLEFATRVITDNQVRRATRTYSYPFLPLPANLT
ncbi:glycosyl transferase family 90-domain-containing protein [Mycena filopes]|nr:glycosyl transferase family 90-domain-containing protein [Mycena filopes]